MTETDGAQASTDDVPVDDRRRGRRSEAFWGRRKTRGLTARKAALVETLLPQVRVPREGAVDPVGLFDRPVDAVHLEIGFGGGEHLAARAEAAPTTGFLGAEAFSNGVAKMLGEIEDRGLLNVRVHDEDAVDLLDRLLPGSLARIDLLYPDPWPKRRNWKRRFVNGRNLARIARVLLPGGEFRFASDIEGYVNWTLRHAGAEPRLRWTAERAGDWGAPWPGWHRTRYEEKALREGRKPAYLRFRRVDEGAPAASIPEEID